MNNADVIIIGGGASGLFASIQLAWQGYTVGVIEHMNIPGKKLLITGKGRCNVTNNSDVENVMANIPRNSRFLYSALSRFAPEDTMAFFESLGVSLKTERGNRVFPVSDKAMDIADALVKYAKSSGVKIVSDTVDRLLINNNIDVTTIAKDDANEIPIILPAPFFLTGFSTATPAHAIASPALRGT